MSPPLTNTGFVSSGSRFIACAAAWCGVHCAVTPLLVLAVPTLALSEGIELGLLLITVPVGALMLFLGPARRHAGLHVCFLVGASLWAASLAGWLEPVPEAVTSAAGSLTLAWTLARSGKVCASGECDVCADE